MWITCSSGGAEEEEWWLWVTSAGIGGSGSDAALKLEPCVGVTEERDPVGGYCPQTANTTATTIKHASQDNSFYDSQVI